MAQCPFCSTELLSTQEIAELREHSARNVRKRLQRGTLAGLRLGRGWVVAPGCDGKPVVGMCPRCGELFVSTAVAAEKLGISQSAVQKLAKRHPDRLMALQIGGRWAIPERGIEFCLALRKAEADALQQAQQILVRPAGTPPGEVSVGQPEHCMCLGVTTRAGRKIRPHRWGSHGCIHEEELKAARKQRRQKSRAPAETAGEPEGEGPGKPGDSTENPGIGTGEKSE